MMNVFSRSWMITKLSFGVIKKDKEMLLFPLLAGIFSILFIIAILVPTVVITLLEGGSPDVFGVLEYVLLFVTYLILAFTATFFNVCVVYTAKKRFEGGDATFGESISFAFSRIHLIFTWSLVAATVGLLLKMIDNLAEKAGQSGKIVLKILNALLGMMWSIITIFVVPAMVYHNLGPIDAIKKSLHTLRHTWGESLIRYYGLGMVQLLFIILGVIIAVPLIFVLAAIGPMGIVVGVGIAVLYFLIVILVFSVANTVFNTALYVYADTGRIPEGFNPEVMKGAFTSQKRGLI
ncbi:DUF6159 family protein [Thermoproteota archaeon]